MFKKIDTALGLKGAVWQKFQDLYQNRCSFLHGTLPSQQLDDGILKLPDLAGTDKTPDKWHDESRWPDGGKLKFDVAPVQMTAIYTDLLALSRSGLSTFLTGIKEVWPITMRTSNRIPCLLPRTENMKEPLSI